MGFELAEIGDVRHDRRLERCLGYTMLEAISQDMEHGPEFVSFLDGVDT